MYKLKTDFEEMFAKCDMLDSISFIGSKNGKTATKVYRGVELLNMNNEISVDNLFDYCYKGLREVMDLFDLGSNDWEMSITHKVFDIHKKNYWYR